MVNPYPPGVSPVQYATPGGPGWPGQPGAGWGQTPGQVPVGAVSAQGPRRSPIDLVAGIAAILTVAVQILRSILQGSPFWFRITRTWLLLDTGNIALWICQLATVIGAILLMTSGHRSATARTVATLGIGGMFCFHAIAVLTARPVYSIGLNWMLVLDFAISLVAVIAIVIGNRSAGLAAQSSATVPGQAFLPQGPPPQLVPQFGISQSAMAQRVAPQQGQPQYQGIPQPGMPQQGIALETFVQQPGSPGVVPQPGVPQQAMPSVPMSQHAMPQQGMYPGGAPSGGNQPASNPG